MAIPKILHFTWKTKTLSKFHQRIFDAWASTHPDWELRLYDDADIRALVADKYPAQLETFDEYPRGIFRADAFRFFVLHAYGGVYADLDVLPLRRIEELTEVSDCFVGAEPETHIVEVGGVYRGMRAMLCNAFMGSVPGHPFWQKCIDRLAECVSGSIIDDTGPRYVNGIALTSPRDMRPDVLPPSYWSPVDVKGKSTAGTTAEYHAVLDRHFTVLGKGKPALVSHLWRGTWHKTWEHYVPQFWRIPTLMRWAIRRRIHRDVFLNVPLTPSQDYDWQILSAPASLPSVHIVLDSRSAFDSETLRQSIDYPSSLLTISKVSISDAAERNRALEQSLGRADKVVFVGRAVRRIPSNAIQELVSANRPVVAGSVGAEHGDAAGRNALYAGEFGVMMYRAGARHRAISSREIRHAAALESFRAHAIMPLTVVSPTFLMIDQAVIAAGVRFAETPYKAHLDGEGFAIMARDKGFEVAGLPNLKIDVVETA